uniref:Uncharacterized protein n=1 Tax=Phaeomonas parva TaxID=124430 RepID=A0A7S1U0T7_9STRA
MSFFDRTGAAVRDIKMDDIVDNIVLERPEFVDESKVAAANAAAGLGAEAEEEEGAETGLRHPVEQATVLALCLDVANSNPRDGITGDEMAPYIDAVVAAPMNWMVHSSALLERSWLECESLKRRERGIFQIQALVDQHTTRLTLTQSSAAAIEAADPAERRLRFLHAVAYPPRWELRRDLAQRYAGFGAFATAAEIYEELGLWEEVVDCFKVLERFGRAERLLRKQLEANGGMANATPRMLTSLGDVTQDPTFYERAWEVSRGRYARAQVNLGSYHLGKGKMAEARDAYLLALAVKPLQPDIWFRLGAITMRLKEWDTSLNAFSNAVMQVPDAAEAWGNVGAIHMQKDDYESAYPALQEGLKHMRRNWRMWENQFITTVNLGKYGEGLYICHQLLDMRDARAAERNQKQGTHGGVVGSGARDDKKGAAKRPEFNVKYLGILVKRIAVENDAGRELSHDRLLERLGALLDRAVNELPSNPVLWEILSLYHARLGDAEKLLDCRARQCRAAQGVARWEREADPTNEVVACLIKYARAVLSYAASAQVYEAKMYLASSLRRVNERLADPGALLQLKELREKVEAKLEAGQETTTELPNETEL